MGEKAACIIGAGLGGLSAAIHLASSGWKVSVFDQNPASGGKAMSETKGAYRFDSGPSLVTMPWVFDRLFARAGRQRDDYLAFRRLDPITRYFFPDGTRVDGWADPLRMAEELHTKTGESPRAFLDFMEQGKKIWDTTHQVFMERAIHEKSLFLDPVFWSSLVKLPFIDPFRTMAESLGTWFRDPRTLQLFMRYATYNGSHPWRVPATLNIIPYAEYAFGGYAVEGGIRAIPQAMEKLARELGVEFHFGCRVRSILHDSRRRVTGIDTDKGSFDASAVISNADAWITYQELLKDPDAPDFRKYLAQEPSSSGLVFYWGIPRQHPDLLVNNIFFSGNYRDEFDAMFDRLAMPEDPTVYVNITSRVDPVDAPVGGDNWFVLVNAPRQAGQDWKTLAEKTRKAIFRRLDACLGQDTESLVEVEGLLDPPGMESRMGTWRGSLYGISSNSAAAAFNRHRNRSLRYPGLYFCGGSVHPGGGMPLVLLSGGICADLAIRHSVT